MNLGWIVPPAVLSLGAVAAAVLARRLAEELDDLRRSARRLRRLQDGMIPVRVETRRGRGSIERLTRR